MTRALERGDTAEEEGRREVEGHLEGENSGKDGRVLLRRGRECMIIEREGVINTINICNMQL